MLVTLQLNPAKTRLISKFVDTYLRLDTKEEQAFQTEIDKLGLTQKEAIMETLTSWEERGMEKGREVERQQIALNMLRRQMPLETISELTGLTIAQLQSLQSQEPKQD
jgi:predicted transposase/invertase (TIGR01784 family)